MSVPPAPPDTEQSKSEAILALQCADGHWEPGQRALCRQLGRTALQIKAATQVVIRKLRDQDLALAHPELEEVVALFTTMVAVEVLLRLSPQPPFPAPHWLTRAQRYIQDRAQEHEAFMQTQVQVLLDGTRQPQVRTCEQCHAPRPAVLKLCPSCFRRESEPYLQPSTRTDEYDAEVMASRPAHPHVLAPLDWAAIRGCQWRAGGLGSLGVILVDLPEGLVVVKCAGADWEPEYVGHALARAAGLACPAMRLLDVRHSVEGRAFWEHLPQAPFTNAHDAQRVSKYAPFRWFYVMEYVPAQPLLLPTALGQRLLALGEGPEESQGERESPGEQESMMRGHQKEQQNKGEQESMMRAWGRLMALDVLMNNYDRLPLVWANEGNPGNVLVRGADSSRPSLVGIDQGVVAIEAPYYPAYEATVQHLVRALVASCHRPFPQVSEEAQPLLARVSGFFLTNVQVALSPAQQRALCHALLGELEALSGWATSGALEALALSLPVTEERPAGALPPSLVFVQQVARSCLAVLPAPPSINS